MAKQIFYLHSCDEWKTWSSMRLGFIGTSKQKLKRKIVKEIELGNMEYCNSDLPCEEQAKIFKKEWETKTMSEINSKLKYGICDYTYNNEEI